MRHIALGYLRLSGRKAGEDITPAVQKQHIERIAAEHNWTVEFYDEGSGLHSARKRTNLPQWDTLFERALTDKNVAGVIGYDLRRLFRDSEAFANAAKRLRKAGVRLIFAQEGEVDPTDPYKWFMSSIQAGAAEMESLLTTDRLIKYNAELRARGIYAGHFAPCGLKRVGRATDGTLHFVPDDTTYKANGRAHTFLDTVIEFLKCYAYQEMGVQLAAAHLNAAGYRWKGRGARPVTLLAERSLLYCLNNLKVYRGIIDDQLLDDATMRYHQRRGRHQNGNQRKRPPLLLWKLARCSACGHRLWMSGRAPAPRTGHHHWIDMYQHPRGECVNNRGVGSKQIDDQLWDHLMFLNELSPYDKAELIRAAQVKPDAPRDNRAERLEAINKRLKQLTKLLADEAMDAESVRILIAEAKEEKARIEAEPAPEVEIVESVSPAALRELLNTPLASFITASRIDPTAGNAWLRSFISSVDVDLARARITKVWFLPPFPNLD